MGMIGRQVKRYGAATPREMGIRRALEWAFRDERACLEFDDLGDAAGSLRQGVDGIWVMMQRGQLGCVIDGGGRSSPAWDAEVIASALGHLPDEWGGKRMAARIAGLARAGLAPDWMPDSRPTIAPVERQHNQYGWTARTESASRLGPRGWPPQARRSRKGALVHDPVLFCPIQIINPAAKIAAARRAYLDWWGALWWIGAELRGLGILATVTITHEMPPMTPWREPGVDKKSPP